MRFSQCVVRQCAQGEEVGPLPWRTSLGEWCTFQLQREYRDGGCIQIVLSCYPCRAARKKLTGVYLVRSRSFILAQTLLLVLNERFSPAPHFVDITIPFVPVKLGS